MQIRVCFWQFSIYIPFKNYTVYEVSHLRQNLLLSKMNKWTKKDENQVYCAERRRSLIYYYCYINCNGDNFDTEQHDMSKLFHAVYWNIYI